MSRKLCEPTTSGDHDDGSADKATQQNHDEAQDVTLLSLVDDCFYHIFEGLSLYDLCSVAQTCKRLHQLGSHIFLRRNKSKVLIIDSISAAGELITPSSDKYMDLFPTSCRNVVLGPQLASQAILKRFVNFSKINQMTPIKKLRLDDWSEGLTVDHGRIMADMLTEVESLTLSHTKIHGDLHDCILKYLPNMKSLTIVQTCSFNWMKCRHWLHHSYPNLEYFAWHIFKDYDKVPIEMVRGFLQINPGIRFFSLQADVRDTVQKFVHSNNCINELSFTVYNPSDFMYLRQLCRKQDTRLHLMFPDGSSRMILEQKIAKLERLSPYIDGLFFEKEPINEALAQALTRFQNLKMLQLHLSEGDESVAAIPTLEVIYAYCEVSPSNFAVYKKILMTFASRMPNLKRIYIRNDTQKFKEFEFDQMDAARKQLAGACKLKIYVRTDEPTATAALNNIQRQYETIDIERAETEEVRNPLVADNLLC